MVDWTRILLYGTYDVFTRLTDGQSQINVILDGGERVEVPKEFIVSADQMVNKNKIKLKDVIARIEGFDLVTKAVWINEILFKLGSNYGYHKYCAGYKQGKFDGVMEREKVTIPQFVADWIEEGKKHCEDVLDLFSFDFTNEEVGNWFLQEKPFDLVARAWLDGYEAEKEKRYLVKIIGIKDYDSYLNYRKDEKVWTIESKMEINVIRTGHTRKELEEAGFGWVFECPGVEVEEVEG